MPALKWIIVTLSSQAFFPTKAVALLLADVAWLGDRSVVLLADSCRLSGTKKRFCPGTWSTFLLWGNRNQSREFQIDASLIFPPHAKVTFSRRWVIVPSAPDLTFKKLNWQAADSVRHCTHKHRVSQLSYNKLRVLFHTPYPVTWTSRQRHKPAFNDHLLDPDY